MTSYAPGGTIFDKLDRVGDIVFDFNLNCNEKMDCGRSFWCD